ncbi:glycerate dehydrogenase [Halolactibacillus alkaliphilus]|uniref:Glycerate dehydrogenase n=1 Tax=Halolactibacillus alkaliphilus TaxID=442899 RepID=A0A511X4X1_9BACI|nr:D-2-hydroxyacid dehydrogenase [Halolactibacillus alkaliphilus]GEN57981.1 glycerate dehydrogenase [Halolactibacillus alkaliphilus]GGN75980.1 glycerate dehydrogenase [Halolactibacillus alkaliphilus]SFP09993.1 Phosphoglycerate dehydrogenase [Halolactibacillus alkaliphilus]
MRVISTTRLTNELEKGLIEAHPSVTFQFESSITEVTNIEEADILMTYGEDLSVSFLESAERLKWIMVLSAGVDEMPLDWIRAHDIVVTNAKGIHKHPMSEYAMAMLLGHYREMFTFYEQQKAKLWNQKVKTREINHRKMTIIGAGAIGEELARLAQAFYIETTAVTKSGGTRPFFNNCVTMKEVDSALKQADFVISILPSTKETRPFYCADHFKLMKNSAVFLNMGRGDVVDPDVLMDALDQGEISHAILDVSPEEPLPEDHPLWSHGKVTLTPHISGKSAHYLPRAIEIFKENLISYLEDQSLPVNKINLSRGY